MAFISKTGISTNNVIEASQITNIIDAFDGTTANQIYMSGPVTASNFHATGSMNGTFSGTLTGNASSATTANTATTSTTASYAIKAQNAYTASLAVSSSYTISSSFSTTASYVASTFSATSASYAATSSYSEYSGFAQIKAVPLIYTGYGSGSNIAVAAPIRRVASSIVSFASIGFPGSSYAGSNILSPYATSNGAEPIYIKFIVNGSGSLGLNGGTGGVPYIVGPTEVVTVDCYLNDPSSIGGTAGLDNPTWSTNNTSGDSSAYVYLWNNGTGPTYHLETAWQSVNIPSFNNYSFMGVDLNLTNGTSKDMTVDNVTMYLSLQKP